MNWTQYGIREARSSRQARNLIVVPHQNKDLVVGFPAFGPNYFTANIAEMGNRYNHSADLRNITFRESTTSESISVAAHGFGSNGKVDAKRNIFDPKWLQLGYIIRTPEGVYVNPPKDASGNPITDESTLKQLSKSLRSAKGIWLGDNDFAFAPYSTFKQGVQDAETFVKGGLARILERVKGNRAEKLATIASNYKRGVNIWGFEVTRENILRVASLDSSKGSVLDRLDVGGGWDDNLVGYAFGVESSGEVSAKKI